MSPRSRNLPCVALFALAALAAPASAQIVNPANGHTYLLTPYAMNIAEARTYAAGLCGYVVAINDAAEHSWVVANFNTDGEYWLGCSDDGNEGTFTWDSGEPFTYSSWCAGEPNNFFLENWAVLVLDCGNTQPGWNDVWPYHTTKAIVEIPTWTPSPGLGQSNSPAATLTVNGEGCGTTGPQTVYVNTYDPPVLHVGFRGPANMPYALFTGTPNTANGYYGCVGWADVGTPPNYFDIFFIMNGNAFSFFKLDGSGAAHHTFSVPDGLPSGFLMRLQGFVAQPSGGCGPFVLTAAFDLEAVAGA
jgi:hypothetical protein